MNKRLTLYAAAALAIGLGIILIPKIVLYVGWLALIGGGIALIYSIYEMISKKGDEKDVE